jgi:hypothetical protein
MRRAEHVARMREMTIMCRNLVQKYLGKRPLVRSQRWWEDINLDLEEMEGGGMNGDWLHGALYRHGWRALADTAVNICFLQKGRNLTG